MEIREKEEERTIEQDIMFSSRFQSSVNVVQ